MNEPRGQEITEAISMWHELEGRTKFDAMNECHQIQLDRIQEAHDGEIAEYRQRIDFLIAANDQVTLKHRTLRQRIDYLYLALFGCALVIGYLAVKG